MKSLKLVLKQLSMATMAAFLMLGPLQAIAGEAFKEVTKTGDYLEVRDDLKNAIVNRGLVVDYVGHLNEMLERTSETVGSVTETGAKSPYKNAEFMQFCAAKLTHEAISANPQNIVNCPYVVYVYELTSKPTHIHIGYRQPLAGDSKISRKAVANIDALLNEIITEVAE